VWLEFLPVKSLLAAELGPGRQKLGNEAPGPAVAWLEGLYISAAEILCGLIKRGESISPELFTGFQETK
jgi:hypothetical protein